MLPLHQRTNLSSLTTSVPEREMTLCSEMRTITWQRNGNGIHFLSICAEHQLLASNTIFQLPTQQKTNWKHPWSKQSYVLVYSITRKGDRRDVLITPSGTSVAYIQHKSTFKNADSHASVTLRHGNFILKNLLIRFKHHIN